MYPKRISTHIKENIAIERLRALMPRDWILRDIAGRDYGHDYFLQIPSEKGEVLPFVIGIQVKYRKNINTSLEIHTSLYRYLHDGNCPNFIFVSDGNASKLFCVNRYIIECDNQKSCSIPNNFFIPIKNTEEFVNYICYSSRLIINKDKFISNLFLLNNDFCLIYENLKTKNFDKLWEYYNQNIKVIHNFLVDLQFGIINFLDYVNIELDIERLKKPYKKNEIFDLMLVTLNCVYVETKNLKMSGNDDKKNELHNMLKNNLVHK